MNLKNYTSKVSVFQTIAKIEEKLVSVGAANISKDYKDGKIVSLSFKIAAGVTMIPIKIPVKTEAVLKYFEKENPRRIPAARYVEQAEKTAWKTVLEWVEIQIQMILLGQVKFEEVFLPYIWIPSKGKTLFESAKDNLLLLTK